jgi:hypothetical protein
VSRGTVKLEFVAMADCTLCKGRGLRKATLYLEGMAVARGAYVLCSCIVTHPQREEEE